jgi:hypothetical protein
MTSQKPLFRSANLAAGDHRRSRTLVLVLLLATIAVASGSSATAGAHPVPHAPDPPQSTSALRAAATAGRVSGGAKALVITLNLKAARDTPRTMPDQTSTQVAHDVIDGSRPWFQEVSLGVFTGYFALKRGPVTVQTTRSVCSDAWLAEIADQADAAVAKHEPTLVADQRAVIYYFGRVDACARANPCAPAGTTQALRLLDGGSTLWLEYRGPSSRDDSGLNGGLLVRREQPRFAGSPFLLFMNDLTHPGRSRVHTRT